MKITGIVLVLLALSASQPTAYYSVDVTVSNPIVIENEGYQTIRVLAGVFANNDPAGSDVTVDIGYDPHYLRLVDLVASRGAVLSPMPSVKIEGLKSGEPVTIEPSFVMIATGTIGVVQTKVQIRVTGVIGTVVKFSETIRLDNRVARLYIPMTGGQDD